MKNKRLNLTFYLCFAITASLLLSCGNKGPAEPQTATPETVVQVDCDVVETETIEGEAKTNPDIVANIPPNNSDALDEHLKKDNDAYDMNEDLSAFFQCRTKVEIKKRLYDSQSIGPTLEEAHDNAVEEACAISCSDKMTKLKGDENKLGTALEKCIDNCLDTTIIIAAECMLDGKSIYSEGAWSETNDSTPTNGDESMVIVEE